MKRLEIKENKNGVELVEVYYSKKNKALTKFKTFFKEKTKKIFWGKKNETK